MKLLYKKSTRIAYWQMRGWGEWRYQVDQAATVTSPKQVTHTSSPQPLHRGQGWLGRATSVLKSAGHSCCVSIPTWTLTPHFKHGVQQL